MLTDLAPLPLSLPAPTWGCTLRGRGPGDRSYSAVYALVRTPHVQALADALEAAFGYGPAPDHSIRWVAWMGESVSAVAVFDQERDMWGYSALKDLEDEGWCRVAYSRIGGTLDRFEQDAPRELQAVINHRAVLGVGPAPADAVGDLVPEPRG